MSEFKSSNFSNEDNSGGPDLVGITTFTSTAYFVPPSGNTAQRPSGDGLAYGTLRFNTDIGRLEVWRGDHWATILGESPNLNGGARGLSVGGGVAPSYNNNTIDYITISTLGNAIDFGDTSLPSNYRTSALGNSTRAVFGGAYTNNIEYVTFSSTGNSTDFGDLNNPSSNLSALSSSTRGIFTGGNTFVNNNLIDYITISSTGNAVLFGNLTTSANRAYISSASSSTRGIFAGGAQPTLLNTIDYITIASTGNAIDFGDLTRILVGGGGANATRMIIAATNYVVDYTQFITISTLGNAQDFGNIGSSARPNGSSCSSTRAVFGGGYGAQTPGNSSSNAMAYFTIATTGNAIDFGDTSVTNRFNHYMCSNGHGGL
jgi:hypothetical protein